MATLPGTWQEPHRDVQFPHSEALELWTAAAVPILEDVASEYGGYITYKEFADKLSELTQIHTKQQLNFWVGKVLAEVISICGERGLPELTSLVVNSGSGMVGTGFNTVLERSGRGTISDPYDLEMAAAEERLKCYLVYCSNLPADPKPQLTREYGDRVKRQKRSETPAPAVCSIHDIQLPKSGICDDCA